MKLYTFRAVPLSIISIRMFHPDSACRAVSKTLWHRPLLCLQCKTPDDGQKNCPKHVEFHSKNKLEKSVHLVGFIIQNSHDARSRERQNHYEINIRSFWFCSSHVSDDTKIKVSFSHSTMPLKCIIQPFVTRDVTTNMQLNAGRITIWNAHPNLFYLIPLSILNRCGESDMGVRNVYEFKWVCNMFTKSKP